MQQIWDVAEYYLVYQMVIRRYKNALLIANCNDSPRLANHGGGVLVLSRFVMCLTVMGSAPVPLCSGMRQGVLTRKGSMNRTKKLRFWKQPV